MSIASILATLKKIYEFLVTAGGLIKLGEDDKSLIKKNQGAWNDVVNASTSGDNSPIFVFKGEDTYLANLNNLPDHIKERIRETFNSKDPVPEQAKITFVEKEFEERILKFQQKERKEGIFEKYAEYIDKEIVQILRLSAYANKLHKEKDDQEAHKVKEDISSHYGKKGRQLCNLYTSFYITGLFGYLEEAYDFETLKIIINKKMEHFINNSMYIFFIHQYTKEEDILKTISYGTQRGIPYLAIHSVHPHVEKAKKIEKKLSKFLNINEYNIIPLESKAQSGREIYTITILNKRIPQADLEKTIFGN